MAMRKAGAAAAAAAAATAATGDIGMYLSADAKQRSAAAADRKRSAGGMGDEDADGDDDSAIAYSANAGMGGGGADFQGDVMDEVRRKANTTSPLYQKANVVLATVADVIRERAKAAAAKAGKAGGTAAAPAGITTPTTYFGTLMSLLASKTDQTPEELAAVMFLVSIAMPHVPSEVLRSRFEQCAGVFLGLFESTANDVNVVRHVLVADMYLLQTLEPTHWTGTTANRLLRALLVYCADPRPKIRKTAQTVTADLFAHLVRPNAGDSAGDAKASSAAAVPNTAPAGAVAIVESVALKELKECTPQKCQVALYWCGLLQVLIPYLPAPKTSAILHAILKLGSTTNTVLTVQCMRTLSALFSADLSHPALKAAPHFQLADDLMGLLLEMVPHLNDVQSSDAYYPAIAQGLSRLTRADPTHSRAGTKLSAFFALLCAGLQSPKLAVAIKAKECISHALRHCITKPMIAAAIKAAQAQQLAANAAADSKSGDFNPFANSSSSAAAAAAASVGGSLSPTPLQSIMVSLESLLNFKYKPVWNLCFDLLRVSFEVLPREAFGLQIRLLGVMDSLHASAELTHIDSLEAAIGAAIRVHGPERILSVLPWNLPASLPSAKPITDELAASRMWLVPLIQQHTTNTTLSTFFTHCIPVANILASQAGIAAQNKRTGEAKSCQALSDQLWDCFVSFATYPTDLSVALRAHAKSLNDVLIDQKTAQLHIPICKGLFTLIERNRHVITYHQQKVAATGDEDDAEEGDSKAAAPASKSGGDAGPIPPISVEVATQNLTLLGAAGKAFLPALFNVMASAPKEQRVHVRAAVNGFASVVPPAIINTLFKNVLTKLLAATQAEAAAATAAAAAGKEQDDKQKSDSHVLVEITQSLTEFLDAENTGFLFRTISPQLKFADTVMQKKSYRILATLCQKHAAFVDSKWKEIVALLDDTRSSRQSAAARSRLQCLKELLIRFPVSRAILSDGETWTNHLPKLVFEAIAATKENNRKTRDMAYNVLVSVGEGFIESAVNQDTRGITLRLPPSIHRDRPLLCEYMGVVMGGLANTPEIQSASVLALARLLYEFKSVVPLEMSTNLLQSILLALAAQKDKPNREVVKAILGFLKVAILSIPANVLQHGLKAIVDGLASHANDPRNRFRAKIKVLFEILLRKFEFNQLRALCTDNMKTIVENIRKEKEKERRDKSEAWQKRKTERKERAEAGLGSEPVSNDFTESTVRQHQNDSFEQMWYGDGDDDDDDTAASATAAAAKSGDAKSKSGAAAGKTKGTTRMFIRESGDAALDLLGADASKSISTYNPNASGARRGGAAAAINSGATSLRTKPAAGGKNEKEFDFSHIGAATDAKSNKLKSGAGAAAAAGGTAASGTAASSGRPSTASAGGAARKRKGGSGSEQKRKDVKLSGEQYRAKRAGGDITRPGMPQPFAFVAMDPQSLNKRAKSKSKATKHLDNTLDNARKSMAAAAKENRQMFKGKRSAGVKSAMDKR